MGQILLLFYIPMANIPVSLKNIEENSPNYFWKWWHDPLLIPSVSSNLIRVHFHKIWIGLLLPIPTYCAKLRYIKYFFRTLSKTWDGAFFENTQPANIGPQGIPTMFPSNVPRTSPKDPIWPSWGLPDPTSWAPLEMTSWGRPNLPS